MTGHPREGRFEIVQTDAGYHVRIIGANGEIVFTSEVYTEHAAAIDAIDFVVTTAYTTEPVGFSDERGIET